MSNKSAMRRSLDPNVYEAFRQLVYLDDVAELAAFMGIKTGTLYNKADAGEETHNQPTLRELVLATHYRGDLRVIEALNRMFGRASFDCAQYAGTSDEALLELLANFGKETGEFNSALLQGLAEKRFSLDAARRVRAEAFDAVSALMSLVKRIEDYVDADDQAAL
ncbi:phage regulatory CII family protein [Paucibacter sp. Y2R2-4]|uniref:phage regulatory CII family protein n=1 Tax=Paucibacter sp. Y2R2-4 TaxID=2893553 RepID=UPI0021E36F82|nr:phage regulatory CII family protein [Paucibacter sp. Y2R2-4]MCV2349323.1 phage regulatory CII family protein [Paucibacter sp. Y2R2-4]